jgi:hypothetical protein
MIAFLSVMSEAQLRPHELGRRGLLCLASGWRPKESITESRPQLPPDVATPPDASTRLTCGSWAYVSRRKAARPGASQELLCVKRPYLARVRKLRIASAAACG